MKLQTNKHFLATSWSFVRRLNLNTLKLLLACLAIETVSSLAWAKFLEKFSPLRPASTERSEAKLFALTTHRVACKTFITLRSSMLVLSVVKVYEWSGFAYTRKQAGRSEHMRCHVESKVLLEDVTVKLRNYANWTWTRGLCGIATPSIHHLNAPDFYANCKSRRAIKVFICCSPLQASAVIVASATRILLPTFCSPMSKDTLKRISCRSSEKKAFHSRPQWPSTRLPPLRFSKKENETTTRGEKRMFHKWKLRLSAGDDTRLNSRGTLI